MGRFIAILFGQLGRAHSLREITQGLAASEGKLKHPGLEIAPSKSTLAYANRHRHWERCQAVFFQPLGRCQQLAAGRGRPFRFKNKLTSLDATVFDLCLVLYDWAAFRCTKGAMKLHLLRSTTTATCPASLTSPRARRTRSAWRALRSEPGTIVVFDRGYNDYGWFAELAAQGVSFVTRMKDNADYVAVETRSVPERGAVLSDEVISVFEHAAAAEPIFFSCIAVWDKSGQRELVFLTNHLGFAASTIAAILQRALANRVVLQVPQTAVQNQELRRHEPQRRQDPG